MSDADRDQPRPRARDRKAMEKSLLAATLQVLARDGFTALGPNAIAAEAGCDKKLIYRYFGGLDGLLAALGADLGLWLAGDPPEVAPGASYAERVEILLMAYARGLRGDLALQRVLAWELTECSEPLRRLDDVRSAALAGWVRGVLDGAEPPAGVDAPALNAVLLAALHGLTLSRRTMGRFAGVDLSTSQCEARIDTALRHIVRRAYAPEPEA
jgi:AcrR family transcriptional regulator